MDEYQRALVKEALQVLENEAKKTKLFQNPQASKDYFRLLLGKEEREMFHVVFLDNAHRMITGETMFKGTINGASVYPREIVKAALKHNAAAMLLGHNHPSGVAEPSEADKTITKQIKDILDVIDVRVLDHLIVSDCEAVSFAERGFI